MTTNRLACLAATTGVASGLLVLVLGSDSVELQAIVAVLACAAGAAVGVAFCCRAVLRPMAEAVSALQETERRLHETVAQSQRDRAQMATIFEHMADGVLVVNANERIELSNPGAARLLRQSQLAGTSLAGAVRDSELVEVVRAARGGAPIAQVVELRPTHGSPRAWVQIVATSVPAEPRTIVLLQDVTDLRRAEAARRDLVANVSHELRTPVASLKALVETLESGALEDPEAGPDFLRRMHVEVDGLAQLVAEVLELARIEAGRLELELRPCAADELVSAAVERIRPYAERMGLDVTVDGASITGLSVSADARRVGQILSNLLSNAVKFTPPGGRITVGARSTPDAKVELWVADTGVGIAADQLLRVFERFYKIDASRAGSGTGLGLAICKHLVRAHAGSIYAESAGPGRGATFRFTLPAADSSGLAATARAMVA